MNNLICSSVTVCLHSVCWPHYYRYYYDDNNYIASLFCTKHDAFAFNSPFWNQMFKRLPKICIIFHGNTLNADISKYYSTSITNPNFSSIYSHSKWLICCRTPPTLQKYIFFKPYLQKQLWRENIWLGCVYLWVRVECVLSWCHSTPLL